MKVYSYCRTSALETLVADGETELVLESELLAIQTYCLQRDWYLFERFQDLGIEWDINLKIEPMVLGCSISYQVGT